MRAVYQKATNLVQIIRTYGPKSALRRYLNHLVRMVWTYKPLWTPRRLCIPLDSININRPIFAVGTQGAGLTLLTRMMRRHPQVVMVGGGPSFWTGFDEMDKHPLGHTHFPEELSLRAPGYRNMTGREAEHPLFGLERSWVYATDGLLPLYRKTAEDATEEVCRALRNKIRSSIRAYATDIQKARFLDKSQSYALKIPLIRACLPDAQFVVQTRDPYVMCWREVTRHPEHKYRYWKVQPSFEEGVRLAAQHWRNTYRIALEDLAGQPFGLFVRFEDLITNLEPTLKRVLDFVDLDFRLDMLPQPDQRLPFGSTASEKWYPVRKDANEKYLRGITTAACRIIYEEVRDIAEEFGYSPPPTLG